MRRLDTTQFLVWIALGAVAFMFLKWRQAALPELTARVEAPELSGRVPLGRLDSLPKPFSRLRLPGTSLPRSSPVAPSVTRRIRAEPGEPIAVSVSAYCLRGSTRLGTTVREGIVAADPRVFPLSSQIDLIIGRDTLRGLKVEDTGLLIKGRTLDLWVSDCSVARIFGRKRGIAVLLPKIRR